MKLRIEVTWDDLVNIVGHAKARGLCRKTDAYPVDEKGDALPVTTKTEFPWAVPFRHPRTGRWL